MAAMLPWGETMGALEFFGDLAPLREDVIWDGAVYAVDFELLDVAQEKQLALDVSRVPEAQRVIEERRLRVARSVHAVNGQLVYFAPPDDAGEDEDEAAIQERERLAWADRMRSSLLFLLSGAYEMAAAQPIREYMEMIQDPNFAAAPARNGVSSGHAAAGRDDALPPVNGPLSAITASRTNATTPRTQSKRP